MTHQRATIALAALLLFILPLVFVSAQTDPTFETSNLVVRDFSHTNPAADAIITPSGKIVVFFQDSNVVRWQESTNGGSTWSASAAISAAQIQTSGSILAAAKDDNTWFVYVTPVDGNPTDNNDDPRICRTVNAGSSWSCPKMADVGTTGGQHLHPGCSALEVRGSQVLAVNRHGTFSGTQHNIAFRFSTDSGASYVQVDETVSGSGTGDFCPTNTGPGVAMIKSGTEAYYMDHGSATTGDGHLWRTTDGGASWSDLGNKFSCVTGSGLAGGVVDGIGLVVFCVNSGLRYYHSTDGVTWTGPVTLDATVGNSATPWIDTTAGQFTLAYVDDIGGGILHTRIFNSVDMTTWQETTVPTTVDANDASPRFTRLEISNSNRGVLYTKTSLNVERVTEFNLGAATITKLKTVTSIDGFGDVRSERTTQGRVWTQEQYDGNDFTRGNLFVYDQFLTEMNRRDACPDDTGAGPDIIRATIDEAQALGVYEAVGEVYVICADSGAFINDGYLLNEWQPNLDDWRPRPFTDDEATSPQFIDALGDGENRFARINAFATTDMWHVDYNANTQGITSTREGQPGLQPGQVDGSWRQDDLPAFVFSTHEAVWVLPPDGNDLDDFIAVNTTFADSEYAVLYGDTVYATNSTFGDPELIILPFDPQSTGQIMEASNRFDLSYAPTSLRISTDGAYVVTCTNILDQCDIWELATGLSLATVDDFPGDPNAAELSFCNDYLYVATSTALVSYQVDQLTNCFGDPSNTPPTGCVLANCEITPPSDDGDGSGGGSGSAGSAGGITGNPGDGGYIDEPGSRFPVVDLSEGAEAAGTTVEALGWMLAISLIAGLGVTFAVYVHPKWGGPTGAFLGMAMSIYWTLIPMWVAIVSGVVAAAVIFKAWTR